MIISLTTGKKMKMKHVFIQLLKTKNIFISHLPSTIGKIVAGFTAVPYESFYYRSLRNS